MSTQSTPRRSADENLHRDIDSGWILPPPAEREPVHTRSIVCRGFRRRDGLIDIEGRFIDTRPFAYDSEWRGHCLAGAALHHMQLRLTVDAKRVIHALESAMPATPYSGCTEVNPNFQRLVGLSIGRGFRQALRERLGGIEGCTHVLALLDAMAAAAVQTFSSNWNAPRPAGTPAPIRIWNFDAMVDSCYSYRNDGPMVAKIRAQRAAADATKDATGAGDS